MSSISLHGHHWSAAKLFHRAHARDAGRHSALLVPTLDDHDRMLFRSKAEAETAIVGTEHALHYRSATSAWCRIAWRDVVAAGRSEPDGATVLRLWPEAARESSVALVAAPHFAAFAAERIAHIRVMCRRIRVTSRVGGMAEAVRVPDSEELLWRVHLDVPALRQNPLIASECERVVTELRALIGA
jgi:hypothetical protein